MLLIPRRRVAAPRNVFSRAKRAFSKRKKVFLIAGEPSGDAIGSKLVTALQRQAQQYDVELEFHGVGGPLMCAAGGFDSLFPMQELSLMGFVELLPHLWRLRTRRNETVHAIQSLAPHAVVTIDSKGFCFGVLKSLVQQQHQQKQKKKNKSSLPLRFHYVAPSVWAYRHRFTQPDFRSLAQLVDHLLVLLPFEAQIFNQTTTMTPDTQSQPAPWCSFVGHPALEDFFELHGLFEGAAKSKILNAKSSAQWDDDPTRWHQAWQALTTKPTSTASSSASASASSSASAAVPVAEPLMDWTHPSLNAQQVLVQAQTLSKWMHSARSLMDRTHLRAKLGISRNTVVVCALVGSRQQEVERVLPPLLQALSEFSLLGPRICVVFPTVRPVAACVDRALSARMLPFQRVVLSDLSTKDKLELFQASDFAIATSGTVVTETTLAQLPTLVVYRSHWITEQLAQWMARVRFVSIPNLLVGRAVLPELIFDQCTHENIYQTLLSYHREVCRKPKRLLVQHHHQQKQQQQQQQEEETEDNNKKQTMDPFPIQQAQLSIALSMLTKWEVRDRPDQLRPLRASDEAARVILAKLVDK